MNRRAASSPQHDEALRCGQTLGLFPIQIGTDLAEERPVDRHDPLLGSLARHLHLAMPMSTSARRNERTSAARSPPSSIANVIALSRWVFR